MERTDGPSVQAGPSADYSERPDEDLVALARGGDNLAWELLLTKYKNVVLTRAKSHFTRGSDRENIVQEGMIGLYKAVRDFKLDDLAPFRAFAELCISSQIITAAKQAQRKQTAARPHIVDAADQEPVTISYLLHPPSPMSEFDAIVRGLPAAAWRSLQRAGYSRDEISAVVGNSAKTIRRKESRDELLDLAEGDRTMRLMRITAEAVEAFGDREKALAWMRGPNVALLGKSPLQMIATEAGTVLVRRSLGVIAYGGVA